MTTDVSLLTDRELNSLLHGIMKEKERRANISKASLIGEDISAMIQEKTLNRKQEDEWRQPLGSFDAYVKGWQVMYDGKVWVSTLDSNVWKPGESGWRQLADEGGVVPWVQPLGSFDAYALGDKVLYSEKTWVSSIDNNVWVPGEYGWAELSE